MDYQAELLRVFGTTGYFVEAGAHDGVGDSQTKRLEDAGWNGICVEPSSAYAGLVRSRKCRTDFACLGDGRKATYREIHGDAVELSGLVENFGDTWNRDTRPHTDRKVQTVTLLDLLASHGAPRVIDFLCLDTEGSELVILENFFNNRVSSDFLSLLVEHNGVTSKRLAIFELLLRKGYLPKHDDGTNFFFVKDVLEW